MSGWQPIETAPKDKTRILVWRKGATRYPEVGVDYWSDKYTFPHCWAMSPYDEQPTMWQPLPEPPEQP